MKKLHLIAVLVAMVMSVFAFEASAQFRFGPRVGLNVNELHFNDKDFSSSNRTGYQLGVMAEFTVPIIGIGADASVLYSRRGIKWQEYGQTKRVGRDYIEFPINLKWRINIPVINRIIRPFITTGPTFAILTSSRNTNGNMTNNKCDNVWNFGFGLEFIQRIQLSASYAVGMSRSLKGDYDPGYNGVDGRTRCWTISAAYLFGH